MPPSEFALRRLVHHSDLSDHGRINLRALVPHHRRQRPSATWSFILKTSRDSAQYMLRSENLRRGPGTGLTGRNGTGACSASGSCPDTAAYSALAWKHSAKYV